MKDTIKQQTHEFEFDTRTVVVRRMKNKAARKLIAMIGAEFVRFAKDLGIKPEELQSPDAFAKIFALVPELISRVDVLIDYVVENATDINAATFNEELDVVQGAAVLAKAIELNLGEELKKSFAAIAQTIAALAANPTKSGAASTAT